MSKVISEIELLQEYSHVATFYCGNCSLYFHVGIEGRISRYGIITNPFHLCCPVCTTTINRYDDWKDASAPDLKRVRDLLKAGKLVAGIREHRTLTGGSLKECKEACEQMAEYREWKKMNGINS